jgi:hypothetical protein
MELSQTACLASMDTGLHKKYMSIPLVCLTVVRIRIHLLRIQGFDDQKLENIYS